MTTAASKARKALAQLTPAAREQHGVLVVVAELLAHLSEQVGELLRIARDEQDDAQGDDTTAAGPTSTDTGAGRPATDSEGATVRLTEPATPPPDDDPPPTRPVKTAKKTAARRPDPAPADEPTSTPARPAAKTAAVRRSGKET